MEEETKVKPYSIVFVSQAGIIELESLFLAVSLRRFLKDNVEIIAATPSKEALCPKTIELFDNLSVEIREFHNPLTDYAVAIRRDLLMTNKIFAIDLISESNDVVFIDSDTIALKELSFDIGQYDSISPRVGFPGGHLKGASWEEAAKACSTTLPSERVTISNGSIENNIPPAFNAGFMMLSSRIFKRFLKEWRQNFEALGRSKVLGSAGFFTEQTAYTLTVHKLGLNYTFLNDIPLASCLLHYVPGKFKRLSSDPLSSALFKSFLEEYPSISQIFADRVERGLVKEEDACLEA